MGKSFVAHGGDSLLAIQLVARCSELGDELSIHDILEATSICQLCEAAQVRGSESEPESNKSPATENDTGSSDSDDQQLDRGILAQIQSKYAGQEIHELFPCTPMQESFLIAQALDPHLYQCSWVVRIEAIDGALNTTDLDQAWAQLVRRHAALRTVFIDSPGRPGHFDQLVLTPGRSEIESVHEDLTQRQSIALGDGQTHRVLLHHDSPSSAVLRVEMLHAITDGQSGQILLRDLCQAYSKVAKSATSLPSYRDFVAYTQQSPAGRPSSCEASQYLVGAESSFFPTLAGAPNHRQGFATVRRTTQVDQLAEYCSKHNVTVANVCQLAWALVLRAYTVSQDICFSYVLSGRQVPLRGIQDTVGAFVNAVICRIKVPGTVAVEDAVARAKSVYLKSLQSQQDATSGVQSKEFSHIKGKTLMSCQRAAEGLPEGSLLKYEVLDTTNPTEVCVHCE